MAPEKVTEMVLNVDLKCSGCYKKVKKVICKFPQIRDQVFDVDKNKVKIVVVCCSPEKIRDKLCYKGGGAIQSIEIIEKPKVAADKPKEPEKAKPAADKPKEPEKAKPAADKPKQPEKAKPPADKPKEAEKPKPKEHEKPKPASDKPKEPEKAKEGQKPADKPKATPKDAEKPKEAGPPKKPDADVAKMVYEPVHGYPQMYPTPAYPMVGLGYNQGYGVEPGYGMPVSYGGFGYEHGYNNNGYNNGNIVHYSSNDHGAEDHEEGCSIM